MRVHADAEPDRGVQPRPGAGLWKDWTQEEAAEHLAPYLGARVVEGELLGRRAIGRRQRVRQFSADEIVAFSRGFRAAGRVLLPATTASAADAGSASRTGEAAWGIPTSPS